MDKFVIKLKKTDRTSSVTNLEISDITETSDSQNACCSNSGMYNVPIIPTYLY